MPSWFFSLRFRLVSGFALVLALALASVSLYVSQVARAETEAFERQTEQVLAERIERFVSRQYTAVRGWRNVQAALEQASALYDRRIVLTDRQGRVVGDSHRLLGDPLQGRHRNGRNRPIVIDQEQVGELLLSAAGVPGGLPEPAVSRLASALNWSLVWIGLVAVAAGVLLISVASRQLLAPLQSLGATARRLGEGNLTQRASTSGPTEVEDLARSFNSMAENLQRAEEQRRHLVADVAHELRTPLSNIQGYLEAVKDGLLEPNDETIDTIHQQAMYLGHIVEDLRLLALAEAGSLRLHLQSHPIGDVLEGAVEAVRVRAEAKDVSVSAVRSADSVIVRIDRTRIAQVVGVLLENAIGHTPAGGSVTVTSESDGSSVRVTVADTGEGIGTDDLPLIFERFYRVDRSRSRATGGAGLGLAIAKQLVEAHGGGIRADSTPGTGSRFSFDLPL